MQAQDLSSTPQESLAWWPESGTPVLGVETRIALEVPGQPDEPKQEVQIQ